MLAGRIFTTTRMREFHEFWVVYTTEAAFKHVARMFVPFAAGFCMAGGQAREIINGVSLVYVMRV
jgi:hypothetical protein